MGRLFNRKKSDFASLFDNAGGFKGFLHSLRSAFKFDDLKAATAQKLEGMGPSSKPPRQGL